jgi:hypothetical protein
MTIKVVSRNVKPTQEQIGNYLNIRKQGNICIRNTNLRFGKLIVLSDEDLDG